MDIAKAIFGERDHEGYVGKEEHQKVIESQVSEEVYATELMENMHINNDTGKDNTAFSGIISSMVPLDFSDLRNDIHCYDEFAFRIEEEEEKKAKQTKQPFIENEQHRLKWMSFLELSQIPRTEKLRSMIISEGCPHSMRSQLWLRLSSAMQKKSNSETSYEDILKTANNDSLMTSKQIERDLLRILPTNACFSTLSGPGIGRLRRILRAISFLYPDIGYCQGTGVIVASLLLIMDEESAFWMMTSIIEDLLPPSYYTSTLIGVQADQKVLETIISDYLSGVGNILKSHDIELSLLTLQWFLTIFSNCVQFKVLLRIWDWFFFDGSIVLFQITLGLLKIKEKDLENLENSAQIFNALSDLPGEIDDVDDLFRTAMEVGGSLTTQLIERHRRRHLAYLMADQGCLVGNPENVNNLPKQRLVKRQLKKNKSNMLQYLFGSEVRAEEDIKSKNIKTTELLVDLRSANLKICQHFITIEPKLSTCIKTVPDYSLESHRIDHENYINVSRNRKRRAKALLDFERNDDDELGFRKNDIITIISQKDEHCWVGELNGLKGWFPAKFVELLDERSKTFSYAGDDAISENVQDLVRGTLCPSLKQIFEHGMKRPSFLGGPCHPWMFIEEAATRQVEKDFNSVYSRLVLCKTYRLDEDGKVLTPEELLFRSIQAINQTHDSAMDVKFRSLICLGLNEQVLHLWIECLCNCVEVVNRWYEPSSFISSPGWVQIKCELRLLSQFAFNLSSEWELLPKKDSAKAPLKDGVRDMLIKHHLFSWDL
ncbi:small G protein signaling modulator 3 [Culicoides brevitarsis]|uniref:small G protein signaling modulator 3 n=1 Tax=Culicoides brevitarsis TaxID=469753 RepID=UPI00307C6974